MKKFQNLSILTILLVLVTVSVADAKPVSVQLRSGRSFTAEVDQKTDHDYLVLRFEGMATKIWRKIAWDRIESATFEGKKVTSGELKSLSQQIKSQASPLPKVEEVPAQPTQLQQPSYARQVHESLLDDQSSVKKK